jgi:prepilin-type N-terminal cleavage/methylation domain-containing protein
MRPAFTLAEVLVAILVFAVGILGLASSGTFIAIQAGEARSLTEATVLAGGALDSLRTVPCSSVTSGQVTYRTTTVRWTVAPTTRTLAVDAVLEIPARQGTLRQWRFSTLLPC